METALLYNDDGVAAIAMQAVSNSNQQATVSRDETIQAATIIQWGKQASKVMGDGNSILRQW